MLSGLNGTFDGTLTKISVKRNFSDIHFELKYEVEKSWGRLVSDHL